MTATPNYAIAHLAPAQLQKEVTVNAALDALDALLGSTLTLDMVVLGATVPLTTDQLAAVQYALTGALAGPGTLVHPAVRHLFVVHNTTSQTVTVKVAGQTGVAIASGQRVLCFCTGSDVTAFATDAEGLRKVYDIGLFFPGKPEGSELIATFVAARAVTIPAGAPDSQVCARIPPTGAVTFRLQKNGADVGTVAMAAGAATGSFTVGTAITLAAGDRLSLVAPAVPDATLEGLSITLAAQR